MISDDVTRLPVQESDLIFLGMPPGPGIEAVLQLLAQRWRESGCRLQKEQLIDTLYSED